MAVTYLGAGTYAAGNNASVTPGLPAGLLNGDLLVLCTSIRDAVGSANTPAGWTLAYSGVSAGAAAGYQKVFYRAYATGVTAPTVTFTGGGSNDTTQAIILAFRDAVVAAGGVVQGHGATYLYNTTANVSSFVYINNTSSPVAKAGDYLVGLQTFDNDSVVSVAPSMVGTGGAGTPLNQTYLYNTSTLGADAGMMVQLGQAPTDVAASVGYTLYGITATAADTCGMTCFHIVGIKTYIESFTGGVKVGGGAGVTLRNISVSQVGAGGVYISGSAASLYQQGAITVVGGGGVAIGGEATTSIDNVEFIYAGSGGAKIGGAAVISNIHPRTWYIDPFNGADVDFGTSWATAFATFEPLTATGPYPLLPGDTVKIAKTPDTVNTAYSYANIRLADWSNQYGTVNGYGLPPPLAANVEILCDLNTSTGWTNLDTGKSSLTQSSDIINTMGTAAYRFNLTIYDSNYTVNTRLCYFPLAATANLSGFQRIEMDLSLRRTYLFTYDGSTIVAGLVLCSDAAGATPLLSIPISIGMIRGQVFSYEGTLPDGVNSIAFYTGPNAAVDRWLISANCLIACKSFSSPDYIGLLSEYRFGEHEAAVFLPVFRYYSTAGVKYLGVQTSHTGAASTNDTSRTLYVRKAVALDYIGVRTTAGYAYDNPGASNYTLRALTYNENIKPAFNLIDINGSASNPINIIGGWDPVTNTVTGKTAIIQRGAYYYYSAANSPIAIDNTSYVNMSNIDIAAHCQAPWAFSGTSHDLSYENMEIHSMLLSDEYRSGVDTFRRQGNIITPVVYNLYFKNCKGTIYPNGIRYGTTYSTNYRLPASAITGVVVEDCIYTTYVHPSTYAFYYHPMPAPLTLIGSLKIYAVAGTPDANNYIGSISELVSLPPVASGSTGTVYAYGAGKIGAPIGAEPSQTSGTYTFPRMVFENCTPIFYSINAMFGGTYAGEVEAVVVPEVSITHTATPYSGYSSTNPANYYPDYLLCFADTPPIHVDKLTHYGLPMTGATNASLTVLIRHIGSNPYMIGVKNATLAVSTLWSYKFTNIYATLARCCPTLPLAIIDTVTNFGLKPATYNNETPFLATVTGMLDVRGLTSVNTSNSYVMAVRPSLRGGFVRFVGCAFSNPAIGGNSQPVVAFPIIYEGMYGLDGAGSDSGLQFVDCTAALHPDITNAPNDAAYCEYDNQGYGVDPRASISIINTTTGAHAVHQWRCRLDKDYTVYRSAPFSWKSTVRSITAGHLSNVRRMGSYPVRVGRVVTVSLWTKLNSISNNYLGLVVHHNGYASGTTSEDLKEKLALNSGTTTGWEQLSIQFVVEKSGMIDIEITHYGAAGVIGWYDDIRIIEQ